MNRNVFIVYAEIYDANGTRSVPDGYPKAFDSHHYNDDVDKAKNRALADAHTLFGGMLLREDRQLQTVQVFAADGFEVVRPMVFGKLADLPDPEAEPEPKQ